MITLLREAGFVDGHLTSICEPMWLGDSTEQAWGFVTEMGIVRGLTESLDDASRGEAMTALHRRISACETAEGVLLGSAAWLITARQG